MENITLGEIVGALTIITVIIGFVATIHNFIKKSVTDRIEKNEKDIKEVKNEISILKNDSKDSKEERLLIVNGLLACLKGLQEQGCNGPVTVGIKQIEEYLMKKSHD